MPTTYGIPGGGLFNEIYDTHRAAGRAEYVTAEDSSIMSTVVGYGPEQGTQDDSVAVPDPDYGGLTVVGHVFAAIAISIAYTLFIVGPIGGEFKPSIIPALLLLLSPFVVFGLSLKWLKKRWMKKNTPSTPASNPRAGVDAEYARHKSPRAYEGRTMYPSLHAGKGLVDGYQLEGEMRQLHEHMNTTGNVPQWVDKDIAGFEKFFGAACEITTARSLREIPGATVINDIILRGKNGEVSANIDHLVCGSSVVMVDAKWWSASPTFLPDSRGELIVSENSLHNRAVSTCVYESEFLPVQPRAIVFSVRGRGADQLGGPKVVSSYHKFVPYEERSQGVEPVPCPVIFTPHDQLRAVVEAVMSGGGEVDGTYIPAGRNHKVDSRALTRLETTTELYF